MFPRHLASQSELFNNKSKAGSGAEKHKFSCITGLWSIMRICSSHVLLLKMSGSWNNEDESGIK